MNTEPVPATTTPSGGAAASTSWMAETVATSASMAAHGLEAEVGAELLGQLHRHHPVLHGRADGGDLLGERADPSLEVGGGARLLTEGSDGQHHVGLAGRLREEGVEGDDAARAGQGPASQVAVGEVGQRIRAEQDQAADAAGWRRPPGCRRRRAPAAAGSSGHAARSVATGVGEGAAPGQQPGRQSHVERAAHVAAPQRDQERGLGLGGEQCGGGIDGERTPTTPGSTRPTTAASVPLTELLADRRRRGRRRGPSRSSARCRRAPAPARPAHRDGAAASARRSGVRPVSRSDSSRMRMVRRSAASRSRR